MANHIEIRQVEVRQPNNGGFVTIRTKFQYRTKDVTASILGLIPLSSTWSDWTDMYVVDVLQDEDGNPSS